MLRQGWLWSPHLVPSCPSGGSSLRGSHGSYSSEQTLRPRKRRSSPRQGHQAGWQVAPAPPRSAPVPGPLQAWGPRWGHGNDGNVWSARTGCVRIGSLGPGGRRSHFRAQPTGLLSHPPSSSIPGFLNSGTFDIWGWRIPCRGGRPAASRLLPSRYQ